MNNFDAISPFYDHLAHLVFGRQIKECQIAQFSRLKAGQKILLPGGGTGWILEELDRLKLHLEIDYVEKSSKMISRAKRKSSFKFINVNFYNEDLLEFNLLSYDVIMTHFFLDVFSPNSFESVFDKLQKSLNNGGIWINTEFRNSDNKIKNLFICFMYLFFRFTSHLEASRLPDYSKKFQDSGYNKSDTKSFYHQLIESCVYSK